MIYTRKYMVVPFKEEDTSDLLLKKEELDSKYLSNILLDTNLSDEKKYNAYNEKLKKIINTSDDKSEKDKLYKAIEKLLTTEQKNEKPIIKKKNSKKKNKPANVTLLNTPTDQIRANKKKINYYESPISIGNVSMKNSKRLNVRKRKTKKKLDVIEPNLSIIKNEDKEEKIDLNSGIIEDSKLMTDDEDKDDQKIMNDMNKIKKIINLSPATTNKLTKNAFENRYKNPEIWSTPPS